MLPAHERLEARYLLLVQIDDGVIVEHQLLALYGTLQFGLERVCRSAAAVLVGRKYGLDAAAQGLGAIERHVGTGEQLLGVLAMLGRKGHADARLRVQAMPKDVVWPTNVLEHAMGKTIGQLLAIYADLQDGELVPSEAAHDVAGTQAALEPVGNALQKAVADEMAVLVVDLLEVIEIDPVQSESEPRVVALELLLEAFTEMEAVGDLCQRVVPREPLDLFVGLALGGDVLLHVDPPAAFELMVRHADHAAVAEVLDLLALALLGEPCHMLFDPVRDAGRPRYFPGCAAHVKCHDIGERRAGSRQLIGQEVDARVRLVADDEALVGIEHRKPAPHMVERRLEAGVEPLERLVALQRCCKLLLKVLRLADSLRARIAGRSDRPLIGACLSRCTERKLESALSHERIFLEAPAVLRTHPRARSSLHY